MTDLCSATSRHREEPLTATASRVERWLLVEHRGAWGPQSVPSSRMPQALARHLARTAADAGARLLMVRRPAGVEDVPGRDVIAVDSRTGQEQVRRMHVRTDLELAGALWDGPEWQPYDGPLYLVCTHGRHDRCCALRGRPVAQALSRRYPDRTWESSHVGGDRFAANVIVLPEGLYLGRVSAEQVVAVVDDLAQGRLPAGHVRGRSSLPLPVQAAQQFAREALNRWDCGDLAPAAQDALGLDTWRVRLVGPQVKVPEVEVPEVEVPEVEVVVQYDRGGAGERHLLTCGADEPKVPPLFRQVSLTLRPSSGG